MQNSTCYAFCFRFNAARSWIHYCKEHAKTCMEILLNFTSIPVQCQWSLLLSSPLLSSPLHPSPPLLTSPLCSYLLSFLLL
ncbi:UNVERIFIED_CONTAM: hypothetical protein FKN15_004566 [Acipenser sinensis]